MMANKPRHRRFGNIRKRASGRYQIRYPGPDGRMRAGPETYERKSDAERALSLIEAQMISGEWADSDRSKIKLQDYAAHIGSPSVRVCAPARSISTRGCAASTSTRTSAGCRWPNCPRQ
jgi:hypothetical protein